VQLLFVVAGLGLGLLLPRVTEPRDMSLLVNGQFAGALSFAVTNGWYETNSKVTTTAVQVPSGSSTFVLACQADDSCHINVWEIELR
jgi:hypothetical protein